MWWALIGIEADLLTTAAILWSADYSLSAAVKEVIGLPSIRKIDSTTELTSPFFCCYALLNGGMKFWNTPQIGMGLKWVWNENFWRESGSTCRPRPRPMHESKRLLIVSVRNKSAQPPLIWSSIWKNCCAQHTVRGIPLSYMLSVLSLSVFPSSLSLSPIERATLFIKNGDQSWPQLQKNFLHVSQKRVQIRSNQQVNFTVLTWQVLIVVTCWSV